MRYEIFYVIGGSKEADLERIKREITDLITRLGGKFEEKEMIFRRALAYPIQHEKYGTFVAQRYEQEDTDKMKEINEKLNLYPDILRYIMSKTDELPEISVTQDRMKAGRADSSRDGSRPRTASRMETQKERKPEKTIAPQESETHKEAESATVGETEEAPKTAERKISDEDIDKKLEEILNI